MQASTTTVSRYVTERWEMGEREVCTMKRSWNWRLRGDEEQSDISRLRPCLALWPCSRGLYQCPRPMLPLATALRIALCLHSTLELTLVVWVWVDSPDDIRAGELALMAWAQESQSCPLLATTGRQKWWPHSWPEQSRDGLSWGT